MSILNYPQSAYADLLKCQLIAAECNHPNERNLQRLPRRFDARQKVVDLLQVLPHLKHSSTDMKASQLTVVCVHLKIISSMTLSAPTSQNTGIK